MYILQMTKNQFYTFLNQTFLQLFIVYIFKRLSQNEISHHLIHYQKLQ